MKKVLALIMVLALAVTIFAGCGSSESSSGSSSSGSADKKSDATADSAEKTDWDYVKENGKLVIGMTLFEPMNYKDENGELTGFETEFAKAVCEELGVETEFQEINWDAKEVELNSKTIDCIWNGMTITDERKENMSISIPYMENKQVMVVRKDDADKYSAAESADGATVIAEAGSAGEDVAKEDAFFKDAKYISGKSQAMALMEVKAFTSDIAIIDFIMSKGTIREDSDYADLTVLESKSFAPEEYGVAFRKGSNVTDKVNEAMQKVADSGKLKEIADKYNLTDMLLVKAK